MFFKNNNKKRRKKNQIKQIKKELKRKPET